MTGIDDDPPTIAERYGIATQSSHLKVEARSRGAIDYVIAAGTVRPLAASLYRLRTEFDSVRAQVRSEPLNRTEMLLVLLELKTLRTAKDQLGTFATQLAERVGFTDATVLTIAGRVLDAWLDPTCQGCDGRGFLGGTHRGEQRIECRGCRGTGERRTLLGDTGDEKRFARRLIEEMSALLLEAEQHIRFKVRDECA